MPRGGKREPGVGKRLGRPPKAQRERQRIGVAISLNTAEHERMKAIVAEYGVNQSDLMRLVIANPWLLRLTRAQLDVLRSLAGVKETEE